MKQSIATSILSDITVHMKYARYLPELQRRETWDELVDRNAAMHIKKYPQLQNEITEVYEKFVRTKKVLPSMRSMQFGGKAIEVNPARIFNCFTRDTSFVTSEGVKTFNDFKPDDPVTVRSQDGTWREAKVVSGGVQEIQEVVFKRGHTKKIIKTTPSHRWILSDGTETTDLKVKDKLKAVEDVLSGFDFEEASEIEQLYWCYGFVYGDGSVQKRPSGTDAEFEGRFTRFGFKTSKSASLDGDTIIFTGTYDKQPPNPTKDSPEAIRAFVLGYLQAGGEKNRNTDEVNDWRSIQTSDKDHWEFIEKCFPIAGVYISGKFNLTGQETNYGVRPETYKYSIYHNTGKTNSSAWVVDSIKSIGKEEVWCVEVPETKNFVLESGIVTGNCSYLPIDHTDAFAETMFLLLSGTGVGYSVQKHHIEQLPPIRHPDKHRKRRYLIGDSISGWADAIKFLFKSYTGVNTSTPIFDFSDIRAKGALLVTSGGKAPGPAPLRECLVKIEDILKEVTSGYQLSSVKAHDILCHIADAVLAGGIRRSAMIALFSADDHEMISSKSGNWWEQNPQRGRANNSAVLLRNRLDKETFFDLWERVQASGAGEPGILLSNDKDWGTNPCACKYLGTDTLIN